MSGLQCPSLVACVVGHEADFAGNAVLVASQWQHRAWTVSLHPPTDRFSSVRYARPGVEPILTGLVVRAHLLHHLAGLFLFQKKRFPLTYLKIQQATFFDYSVTRREVH